MNKRVAARMKLSRFMRREILLVLALVPILAAGVAFLSHSPKTFASVEVQFTDTSAHGLAIVPASCPSDPTSGDTPWGCSGSTPLCPNGSVAPNGDLSQCGVGKVCPTGYINLYSNCVAPCHSGNSCICYRGGTPSGGQCLICPVGETGTYPNCVVPSNTCPDGSAAPNGNPSECSCAQGNTSQCGPGWCPIGSTPEGGQCVFTGCPSGYTQQGDQCVIANCPVGWTLSGSSCTPPLSITFVPFGGTDSGGSFTATGHLQVFPPLVRSGNTVQVYWDVANAQSCSVTGTNGDSWTGLFSGTSGQTSSPIIEQTIYTLSCESLSGASPASVTESKTVNVVPVFQEI